LRERGRDLLVLMPCINKKVLPLVLLQKKGVGTLLAATQFYRKNVH